MTALDHLLKTKKTLVCVGPGGVGKTTTSAALALRASMLGRKTLVMTVDPAHRLANSLGLESFEAYESAIPEAQFAAHGLTPGAPLYAMMLDTKRTFDAIVDRYAPTPEVRDRILASPFYEQASTRLAGSQEYMAMEKLYELQAEGNYDLLVLDTPPTVHALDFLDAPSRLEDFMNINTDGLGGRGKKALGRIGRGFMKVNSLVVRGISRFLGTDLFMDILDFLSDWRSMYTGFKDRAGAVKQMMRSDDVAFVVLTGPENASVREGLFFRDKLVEEGMPFGAFVVNRVRTEHGADTETLAADFRQRFPDPPGLADKVLERYAAYRQLVVRDARELSELRERVGDITAIPDFERDIHDLASLHAYGGLLLGDPN